MLKYLRIAVTALSLTACVLLIALWVRSYWRFDKAQGHIGETRITYLAAQGKLMLYVGRSGIGPRWEWRSKVIGERHSIGFNRLNLDGGRGYSCRFFSVAFSSRRAFAWMHFWLPVSLIASLAGTPWLRSRFSLRTLLIATTLVAVGLGVFVITR
jgi:hypothetical protein